MTAPTTEKITLREKLGYGVGDLASGLMLNFFGYFILIFFVDIGGLAPAAIGFMLLITKLFDAVTDPVMGIIADRTRSRWGRYRPYLLFGTIPFAISMVLIFSAPEDMGGSALLIWAYVTYTICMVGFTATHVPYGGLLGVISASSQTRSTVTGFRMFFSALGGILVGALGTTLVRELGGGDDRMGILLTISCIAAVAAASLLTTFATTKERIPPVEQNGSVAGDLDVLVKPALGLLLLPQRFWQSRRSLRARAQRRSFSNMSLAMMGRQFSCFFDRPALFLTSLALGQLAGVVAGIRLQKRFEKSHLLVVAGLLKSSMIMVFYFLPLDAVWPQTLTQFGVGIGFGVMMVLSYSMFTDIAEYIAWKSGRLMTALVIAASVFGVKAGVGLGSFVPGTILEWSGYVAETEQTDSAIMGIQMAFALVPAAILIPAVVAMLFYNIDRRTLVTIESELAQRRAESA